MLDRAKPRQSTTKVSSRGQVVLPASVRTARNWGPGTELVVLERGDEVVLRKRSKREELYPPVSFEEALKRLPPYDGPSFTDEEIEQSLSEHFRRDWWRENGG